jgi:tetratricopeptide (TPR) repeat protein
MMREVEVYTRRLPVTGPGLFGRAVELAWLTACWQDGVHVASVVAWGGIGKTALVNRWLADQRDKEWDGAARVYAWSFYSQGTDRLGSSDEFIDAALRWFGDPDPMAGSPWDKGERLARLVRKERTLLVLDGVEPLQWGPGVQLGKLKDPALEALVKELGAQNKGLCVITSRIAVADLDGMRGDKVSSEDLGSLSPEAGADLLKARGAKGSDEELREASSEYKGHGLALTLLGGYIRKRHKGDIRQRAHIPVLEGRPAQRMMGIYERWFAGKAEIAVLRLLGLFDRPATVDEIAALRELPYIPGLTTFLKGLKAGAWNEAVTTLQDVGLLAPASAHDDRLDAHPLVREHFGLQLRQNQQAAWREGHRRLYVYLKDSAAEWPETIEEMAPLYAAVVHGCLAKINQEALIEVHWKRIRRSKESFSVLKLGAFSSEVAVLSAFFDPPWEALAAGLDEFSQAWVLNAAGFALLALGRVPDASELVRLSLVQLVAKQDWKAASVVAANLSDLLQVVGKLDDALAQARKSSELAERSGDADQRMWRRTTLASVLHAIGLWEDAAAHFEEAERMQKDGNPAYPLLSSLRGFQYCALLLDQSRDSEVWERATQALQIAKNNHWLLDTALDHLSLGRAHLLSDRRATGSALAPATSHLQQAVDGLRRASRQDYLPLGLLARAALHIHTRDFPAARYDLDETLTLATRCGFRLHEADARLALAEGRPAVAREHFAKARRIIGETGYHRRDGELAELEATASTMVETAPPQAPPSVPPSAPAPRIARSMPTLPSFPQPILDAYRDRKLAILFGSGLSIAPDVQPRFPRWKELPLRFLDHVEAQGIWSKAVIGAKRTIFQQPDLSLDGMLSELDTLAVALQNARKYQAALSGVFRPANPTPGEVHRALVALDLLVLATTNFDSLFEHAEGPPTRAGYTWRDADNALADIEAGRKVLFKMHGTAENEATVVMTRREYDRAATDVPYQRIMSHLFQNYTFLLVGYGINDPRDLDLVFELNTKAFGVTARAHYALIHKDEAAPHRDRWQRDMNIQVVPYDDHGQLPKLLRKLAKSPRNPP